MAELVADCPRCGAKMITFNAIAQIPIFIKYDWQYWFEVFCVCRGCNRSTTFILSQIEVSDAGKIKAGILKLDRALNYYLRNEGFISTKDIATVKTPEHLPANIELAFKEGATCMAVGCYNAAGTMFRLCIDLSTRGMMPDGEVEGLNSRTRRNLGLRLPWLLNNGYLPESLRELSSCVKEDGNDGAHEGTLTKEEAEDLLDFTSVTLERIYTEPKRLQIAKERRESRRKEKDS